MDPISSIANAVGSVANSVGSIFTSKNNASATKAQANAQMYISGQITEQEYIRLQSQEENNLSGTVNSILNSQQKTDYLPYVVVAGILLVVAVAIIKKSKA